MRYTPPDEPKSSTQDLIKAQSGCSSEASTENTVEVGDELSSTCLPVLTDLKFRILNVEGIHLRPCQEIVSALNQLDCEAILTSNDKPGKSANGKSIFDLMFLGATSGEVIQIKITGNDHETARTNLLQLKFWELAD